MRRRFISRAKAFLKTCPNNALPKAMAKDRRRRESMKKMTTSSGEALDPGEFTRFMTTPHSQNQQMLRMIYFRVREEMEEGIKRSIYRCKLNNAPGKYAVQNEMVRKEQKLMTSLIYNVWKLIGRSK